MSNRAMEKLTALEVKQAHKTGLPKKLPDGGGLNLIDGRYWRYRYRFNRKENTYSCGVYPDVSLKLAREQHREARLLLNKGADPNTAKTLKASEQQEAIENTFGVLSEQWLATKTNWVEGNRRRVVQRLENDALPWLQKRPITEITPPELLRVLKRIESRGAIETARRVKQYISQIFRFAIAQGLADSDPSRDLTEALKKVAPTKHFPSITEPKQVGPLLKAIRGALS